MLAKRRRICVDTQTDSLSTIRMRDVAITVEEPKVYSRDVSVLTEVHEDYQKIEPFDKIVMRVKEMSTTTRDFPKLPLIHLKDAANITDDHGDEHDIFYYLNYEFPIKKHDDFRLPVRQLAEGSSNTDHAPSNLETKERDTQIDQFSEYYRSVSEPQPPPPRQEVPRVVNPRYKPSKINLNEEKNVLWPNYYNGDYYDGFRRRHRHPDDSIISINLPDKMNITIESPNSLESKVQVFGKNEGIKQFHGSEVKTETEKADALEIFSLFDKKFDELDSESGEWTEAKLDRLLPAISTRCRKRIPSGKYVFSSKIFQCSNGEASAADESETKAIADRLANLEIIERTDESSADNLNFLPGFSEENKNLAVESDEKNDGQDSSQSPYDVCLKTIEKLEYFLSKIHCKDDQVSDKNELESETKISETREVENLQIVPEFCEENDEIVTADNHQDQGIFNYLGDAESQSSSRKYFSPFVRNYSRKFVPKKKYQHPFSPRNIFLRFLHERRKIVQDSFGTGKL